MHWIIEFIVRYRNFFSLLLTSVISLYMISGSPERQAKTARALTVSIFYPMQLVLDQTTQIQNIFSENRRLRREVVLLNAKVSTMQEQAVENDRLIRLLEMSGDFEYELVPVRVIARDPSPLYRSIVVNAGRRDSILMWMPLVSERGVVGKVVQVLGGMSLVQLLKDPSNRTGVMSSRTRTVSILETENGSDFFFRCRRHEEIEPGDTVVTSGLGGIYPRGLRVGFIRKIEDSTNPLFKKAILKLSVDFDHLEELFIIKLSPQWAAFREQFDSLSFEQ